MKHIIKSRICLQKAVMGRALLAVLIFTQSTLAAVDQAVIATLPEPDRIFLTVMKDVSGSDVSVSKGYWENLKVLCSMDPYPKSLCTIPAKIVKWNQLLKKVFAKNGDVLYSDDMTRKNLWDIRELTSANFQILPNKDGPEQTLKNIVDIFLLRNEILRLLNAAQVDIKKRHKYPSENMLLTIPFMRASVYAASPLGAALTIFNTMRCTPTEKLCDLLKARQGGVMHVLLENATARITNLHNRLLAYSNDEAADQSRRLRAILSFAEKVQNDQKILNRDGLTSDLLELVGAGQGGYADIEYQNLARHLVILSEAVLMNKMAVNFAPYADEISNQEKLRIKKQLVPLVKQSLDAFELGLVAIGVNEEPGD